MTTMQLRTEDDVRHEIAELARKKDIVLNQCRAGHEDAMAGRRNLYEYQRWSRKAKAKIQFMKIELQKLRNELANIQRKRKDEKAEEGKTFARIFMQNAYDMLPKPLYDAIIEKTLVNTQKGNDE